MLPAALNVSSDCVRYKMPRCGKSEIESYSTVLDEYRTNSRRTWTVLYSTRYLS